MSNLSKMLKHVDEYTNEELFDMLSCYGQVTVSSFDKPDYIMTFISPALDENEMPPEEYNVFGNAKQAIWAILWLLQSKMELAVMRVEDGFTTLGV